MLTYNVAKNYKSCSCIYDFNSKTLALKSEFGFIFVIEQLRLD